MSLIKKYAHAAEIIDRIIVESLKSPEFLARACTDGAQKDALMELSNIAESTAGQQAETLRERLLEYDNGELIAGLVCSVIRATISTSTVARFENLKRQEQLKEEKNTILITNWDHISRNACEVRAQAKAQINVILKELFPSYEFPAEVRTF